MTMPLLALTMAAPEVDSVADVAVDAVVDSEAVVADVVVDVAASAVVVVDEAAEGSVVLAAAPAAAEAPVEAGDGGKHVAI